MSEIETVVGQFRPVPYGWNSASWTERASAHYDGTDFYARFSGKNIQEWKLQMMNEPGSPVVQYSWACENSEGLHIKEGQLVMEVPPMNLIHAREALSIYMNENQDEFGIDPEVNLKSWRP